MKLILKNSDGTRTEQEVNGLPGALLTVVFLGIMIAVMTVIVVVFIPVILGLVGWALVVGVIALPVVYLQDRAQKRRRVQANRAKLPAGRRPIR